MPARPAHTYRASKKSKGSSRTRTPGAVISHDQQTDRGIQRSDARTRAGRWSGIGDPNTLKTLAAIREREAKIAEAAAIAKKARKPRVRKTVKKGDEA